MATDHNFKVKNGLNVEGAGLTIVADGSESRITSGGEIRFRPDGSSSNKVRITLNTLEVQGNVNTTTGYQVDGSNVIDGSGNWAGGSLTSTSLDINGNATVSGWLNFDGGDNNGLLRIGGSNVIGKSSNWLYIDANTSFSSGIYINNLVKVDGGKIGSYNEDLQLRTANTTALTLSNTDQSASFVSDVSVAGDLAVTGDLNITGDINSVSVTDLDVLDKTITLGVGQSAANSTGSGIVISGSNAELKWHNANDRFEFNKAVHSDKFRTGNVQLYASGDDNHLHISAPSGVIPPSTTTASNSSLGTSSYRWNGIFSSTGDFAGNVTIAGADVDIASIIRHIGDTNTYFGFHGNDLWRVVTGGVERFEVGNSGIRVNDTGVDMDFTIESNDSADMFFVDGGNNKIGIGTSSPASRIHVYETVNNSGALTTMGTTADGATVRIENNSTTTGSYASLFLRADTGDVRIAAIRKSSTSNDVDLAFVLDDASESTSVERMRIVGESGNIGIGTNAPDSRLHIASAAAAADDLTLLTLENGNSTGDISTPNTFIDFKFTDSNSNVTPQARIGAHAGEGGDSDTQIKEGRGYLTFHTSDTTATSGTVAPPERMRISHDGKVGIGTDPGYPLDVASTATTSIAYQRTGVSAKKWGFDSDNAATYLINLTDNVRAITAYNDGKIGIGTISPKAELHVRGPQIIGEAGDTDQTPLFFEWVKSNTGSDGSGVWYKVANISLPNQGYSAIAFSATYVTGINNYGNHDYIRRYENFITIVRNSGSSANNSPDTATVRGVTDSIRVYKTGTGTYELQAKGDSDNMEYHVEVKVFQGGANRITPVMDGSTAGTTSGGTAYGVATMVNGLDGIIRHSGVTDSKYFNASNGSEASPSITFAEDTDTGFYKTAHGSLEQVNISTDGTRRAYFNDAGITSFANVYTSANGSFRNYGSTWGGTTGVANNGFYFLNTANSNTTRAMDLSHDGNVVFAGTLETTGGVTHNVSADSEEFMIKATFNSGHRNALTLNHEYDRDIGIHFHTSGGDYEVWIDSAGDDSLILSPGTAGNPALELYQNKDAQFFGNVTVPVNGTNFILNSDTTSREAIDFRQNNSQKWTLDINSNGDLNFVPKDGDLLKYNGNELATKSYVTGLGYLTSSSGLNASNLTSGTIPSARFPDNIFDSYRRDTIDSSSEDFDNYVTTGTYAVNNWSESGDTVANGPTNSVAGDAYPWGVLKVTNWQSSTGSGSGYVLQEYWPHQTDTVYSRIMWNGSFTGWRATWGSSNDGSGSGLDADKVDGIEGASLLRSDTADTASGVITFSDRVDLHEIRSNTGQEVIINVGESSSYASTQNAEYLYVNADTGFQVNVSPDNWSSGWAGRKTLTYDGTNGLVTSGGFSVDTSGNLSATTKSFDIEHPTKEGMRLRYGVLEGPENGVYVRGRTKGSVIQLPDHWTGLVHEDSITVQLTPIGKSSELYVKDIADNKVLVSNDTEYFYYIMAERKDVERFEVEYEV